MIVCHCEGVASTTIEAVILSGASSVDEVGDRCGAGSGCGTCWPTIEAMLSGQPVTRRRRRLRFGQKTSEASPATFVTFGPA